MWQQSLVDLLPVAGTSRHLLASSCGSRRLQTCSPWQERAVAWILLWKSAVVCIPLAVVGTSSYLHGSRCAGNQESYTGPSLKQEPAVVCRPPSQRQQSAIDCRHPRRGSNQELLATALCGGNLQSPAGLLSVAGISNQPQTPLLWQELEVVWCGWQ